MTQEAKFVGRIANHRVYELGFLKRVATICDDKTRTHFTDGLAAVR